MTCLYSELLVVFQGLELVEVTVETVVVFDASILELTNLVELLKGDKLLGKVLVIELVKVFEGEDAVFFQLSFEDFSQLLGGVVSRLEQLRRIPRRLLIIDVLILNYIHTSLEEPILLGSLDFLALDYWLFDFAVASNNIQITILRNCILCINRRLGHNLLRLRHRPISVLAIRHRAGLHCFLGWCSTSGRAANGTGLSGTHADGCSLSGTSLCLLLLSLFLLHALRLLPLFHFSVSFLQVILIEFLWGEQWSVDVELATYDAIGGSDLGVHTLRDDCIVLCEKVARLCSSFEQITRPNFILLQDASWNQNVIVKLDWD